MNVLVLSNHRAARMARDELLRELKPLVVDLDADGFRLGKNGLLNVCNALRYSVLCLFGRAIDGLHRRMLLFGECDHFLEMQYI